MSVLVDKDTRLIVQGISLGQPVTEVPCCLHGNRVAADCLGPGTVMSQERSQGRGEGDDPSVCVQGYYQ